VSDVPITITVQYSCTPCGIQNAPVKVPARMSKDGDVAHWVKQIVGKCVSDDHARRSPHCPSRTMRDLKIPIESAEHIGGPPVQ
jgi:hypothetical protein